MIYIDACYVLPLHTAANEENALMSWTEMTAKINTSPQFANLPSSLNECSKTFSFEELDFFCLTGVRPIGNMLGLLSYKGTGDEGKLYLN